MTQMQVAAKSGLSQSNINTWERGRSMPLPDGLIALADCFDCSIDYLLGHECENFVKPFSEECEPITEGSFAIEKFSEILKALRKERKLTQQELAERSGISRSNINTWESGKSLPLPDGLIALADAFGCSVDYLLGRESEDGSVVIAQQYDFSDNELKMIKMFRALNERRQALALVYVEALYDSEIEGI